MQITDVKELLDTHADGEFLNVAEFNGHTVGTSRITGTSRYWEMHLDSEAEDPRV
ncbi:MAG: hypothetical protein AB8G18_17745 [Gammaproteobacteria bacterium]